MGGYGHAFRSGPSASGKTESYMYRVPRDNPDTCPSCKKGTMRAYGLTDDSRSVMLHCTKGCGNTETRPRMDRVQDMWGGA